MQSFSDRHNLKPKKMVQISDMDYDLRVSFWNLFYAAYKHQLSTDNEIGFYISELYATIWCDFLKQTIDRFPHDKDVFLSDLRDSYFHIYCNPQADYVAETEEYAWPWWKVYEFLEFVSENDKNITRKLEFQSECNIIMERELSGYRFIDNLITPITSKNEIEEIESAIHSSTREVQIHIHRALILLSDRKEPDYRNSIKESISALEAQCKLIAEDNMATLTKALDKIEKGKQVKIHPYLKEAFQKIYSWTNNDEGIRHSLKDEPTVDNEDAQFMLIACSAFINYLQVKKMKSISQTK
ncbi:MAG: hypothetical protein Q7T80_11010 [Methanoregula sp.]|nr:hypothetical protein [Methanoregula sp.]